MQAGMIQRFTAMAEAMQHNAAQWRDQQEPPQPVSQPVDPVWRKPDAELREQVSELEQRYGSLPLTLRTWFESVGEIDLCGVHPRLSQYVQRAPDEQQGPDSDPLVVACITSADELDYLAEEDDDPQAAAQAQAELALLTKDLLPI